MTPMCARGPVARPHACGDSDSHRFLSDGDMNRSRQLATAACWTQPLFDGADQRHAPIPASQCLRFDGGSQFQYSPREFGPGKRLIVSGRLLTVGHPLRFGNKSRLLTVDFDRATLARWSGIDDSSSQTPLVWREQPPGFR